MAERQTRDVTNASRRRRLVVGAAQLAATRQRSASQRSRKTTVPRLRPHQPPKQPLRPRQQRVMAPYSAQPCTALHCSPHFAMLRRRATLSSATCSMQDDYRGLLRSSLPCVEACQQIHAMQRRGRSVWEWQACALAGCEVRIESRAGRNLPHARGLQACASHEQCRLLAVAISPIVSRPHRAHVHVHVPQMHRSLCSLQCEA